MTAAPIRLLLLEDNPGDARLVQTALAEHAPGEFSVTCVERLADALARIGAEGFDAVLCDLGLPDSTGLATAQAIVAHVPALPLVVLTRLHDQGLGREAIQHGAQDYLVKGESGGALIARTLRYAIERKRLEIGLRTANEALELRVAERTAELETANSFLRASAARYRAMTQTATDAIISADAAGKIVGWNSGAERMFGYTEADVIGQPLTLLMPQRYQDRHLGGMNRVQAGGERHVIGKSVELHGLSKTGNEFPIELSLSQWESSEGTFFTRIIRDISERKLAEDALAGESRRNQAFLRSASDGVHIVDADGNVLEVSDSFCEMLGYSREDLIGANASLWDAQWSPQELKQVIAEQLVKGGRSVFETKHRRRNGSILDVEVTGQGLELEGKPVLFNSTRDITERKRAERLLGLEHTVARCLADAGNASEALKAVIRAICETENWECGRYLSLDDKAGVLRFSEYWSVPDPVIQRMIEVSCDITYGLGVALSGTVWQSGHSLWIADITKDARAQTTVFGVKSGMRGAFAFPVKSEGKTIGVFVFNSREVREPDTRLQDAVLVIGSQIGQFLQRKGVEAERIQLTAIVENSNDAIISRALDGNILSWNASAERLFGYSAAEAIGRPINECIDPPEARAQVAQNIEKMRRGEAVSPYETRRKTKDGRVIDVLSSGSLIKNSTGEVIGTSVIFQDISALKQAENQLLLHAAALDAAANAIIITARDGTICWTNPAFTKLTGYSAEEMIGQNPRILKSGRQNAEFYRTMYATILSGAVWQGEIVNRYKDGRLSFEEQTITPVRGEAGNGEITHFIAIKQDITERKRSEQEIRDLNASLERRVAERTLQLEEANRAKSDFLANMSHELRTPLNSIIGFSEMLRDGVLGELDAKQRGFVADIFDAGTHLLSLINDILDLSKVEAGMLQLEADAVDVPALLKASTLVVREKALAHRIRLDTRLDPALGTMLTDERKLKQIVYNLLSNAVNFTPDGGAVTLRARRCARAEVALDDALPGRLIALPLGEDGEFLEITVEDTGVGIAEEHLPKLFEPFTQVDTSVARRHAGTGLGLSLVRRLAELHGGTVGVASRPGAGSRFCVWLPYREAAPAAQEGRTVPEGTAPSAPAVPLALVIEDDDQMADLITAQLTPRGSR